MKNVATVGGQKSLEVGTSETVETSFKWKARWGPQYVVFISDSTL